MRSTTAYLLALTAVVGLVFFVLGATGTTGITDSAARRIAPNGGADNASPETPVRHELAFSRESAAPQSDEEPSVEPPQTFGQHTDSGYRWAVSNLSSEAHFCIRYHQDKIREYLPYMEGGKQFDDEARYGRVARVVALYSAMVIMAAEGQAIPNEVYNSLSREELSILEYDSSITVGNNGLCFPISRSRFGIYYQIKSLLRSNSDSIPVQEVPLGQVVELAHEAMSYRVQ